MSVKSHELDNPERGMDLATRGAKSGKVQDIEAVYQGLLNRIRTAKADRANDTAPHCFDCFRRGWEAALRAIEAPDGN